jgi:DNA polymerase-3 subunit epsilon
MRQIILDTETTGLEVSKGHRIIEVGCIELINRRVTDNHWHYYFNPDRKVDIGAFEVHGISNDFLSDKPRFEELADSFLDYIDGSELIIHNAPFDVGFLNMELAGLADSGRKIEDCCGVLDTLLMARQKHPGQKNNLDALCKRYLIDNSHRSVHGALLDARILADVYLVMTGGQTSLGLDTSQVGEFVENVCTIQRNDHDQPLPLWQVEPDSEAAHKEYLEFLATKCDQPAWK